MPLYEYRCTSCSSDFELLVRPGDAPACPSCGGSQLEKQFSVPAAHSGSSKLSLASMPAGGCGKPGCGPGGCGMGFGN